MPPVSRFSREQSLRSPGPLGTWLLKGSMLDSASERASTSMYVTGGCQGTRRHVGERQTRVLRKTPPL